MIEAAAAARAAGAPWLGVATIQEALRLREAGDTGRLLAGSRSPATTGRRAIERDVDVTAYTPGRARRDPRSRHRHAGPPPAQGRHRPLARWLDRGPVAGAAGGRPRRRGRRRLAGDRHLVALRVQRRARPTRRTTARSGRSATLWPAPSGRAATRGPAPRQLRAARSCDRAAGFDLVRCGIASYGLDPAPGLGPDVGLEPAMTVTAPLALTKRIPSRRRRLLRPHLDHAGRDAGRPGPAGVRRRRPAARREHRRGLGRRQAPPGPRPDLHGPVRRRPR